MTRKQTLDAAVAIGAQMLKSGAEIYRVEQTIYLICEAYNIEHTDVYAIPSSIIATAEKDGRYNTKTKRILKREINLEKLSKLNELSRYICSVKPEYGEIAQRLNEINQIKKLPDLAHIVLIGVVGFGFTIFFGGTFKEAVIAIPIGMLMRFVLAILEKQNANFIFYNISGSFIVTLLIRILLKSSVIQHADSMTIGILMALVPGITVTNGMRDLIAGDFMAAIHRFTEALLVALGIALGTFIAISIIH